jgi:hypothetical protein
MADEKKNFRESASVGLFLAIALIFGARIFSGSESGQTANNGQVAEISPEQAGFATTSGENMASSQLPDTLHTPAPKAAAALVKISEALHGDFLHGRNCRKIVGFTNGYAEEVGASLGVTPTLIEFYGSGQDFIGACGVTIGTPIGNFTCSAGHYLSDDGEETVWVGSSGYGANNSCQKMT